MNGIGRGLLAGAAGAAALNAATYADMAGRGRPASQTPQQAVERLAQLLGRPVPGHGPERDNRVDGLAGIAGLAVGVTIGGAFGWLRQQGLRLGVAGPALIGGAAMAATDVTLTQLGLSDPRTWSAQDWLSDALPHLAYGCVTQACLTAADRDQPAKPPARLSTVMRAGLAGLATGGRTTAGLTALALTTPSRRRPGREYRAFRGVAGKLATAALAAGELTMDKQSGTPPRTEPAGAGPRAAAAATVGAGIARRAGEAPAVPVAAAIAGSAGGAAAGLWWRTLGAGQLGLSPLRAALVEDAVVATLAGLSMAGRATA